MREHRRAVAFLGQQQIERMLALPEGVRVLAARDDFQRCGVSVIVEGPSLDPQPEGCVLPYLPVEMSDPSVLAMRATVSADWCNDGTAELSIGCPVPSCQWSREWPGYSRIMLALLADTVQQHIIEAHQGEQA